jgi:hypothetical protein
MNFATKYTILKNPFVSYDFSYFEIQSESFLATARNSTMSNGFSYSQQYNTVFSGGAGAQRIDVSGSDPNSRRVVYQANASLIAVPLPTLHHSLSYGYQKQKIASGGDSSSNSVYMTNAADLYKGVVIYVNGGETWAVDINHENSTSVQYSYGFTLTPRKTLTITGSSTYSKSVSSSFVVYSRSDTLDVAYAPFTTMFVSASWTKLDDTSHHDRLQNYSFSWSPFPGGDLIISLDYLEVLQMQNNSILKTLQESVRWNINRKMYVRAGYADSRESSDLQRALARTFSAELSIAL